MTYVRMAFLAAFAGMMMPGVAMATGSLGCAIDDANMKLELEALFSYSDIGGLFQTRGEFQSKVKESPEALRKFALADSDIKQQWMRDKQLKLMIYREAEGADFASVKLIIEATQPEDEDFAYSGRYKLEFEPLPDGAEPDQAKVFEGNIGCSAG
ncbi:MAG: hypothetical protein RLZZ444_3857 [Pseudomonadota bacterium]